MVWGSSDPTERTGLERYATTILNSASSAWGGAVANEGGSVYVEDSLLVGNSAQWGGAYNGANGSDIFLNTAVISSTATRCGAATANCNADAGLLALEGAASWSSDATCGQPVSVSSSFNLGPLALNGGTTPNHLPQAGSALLESAGACTGVTHDQRGTLRPGGAACDVGAVETSTGAPAMVHLPFVVR